MKNREVLGIDFGGSGIKGAPIDIKRGVLLTERYRIPTPSPATPDAVADTINKIVQHFNWKGPIGVGFPAVVINGVIKTASNIDKGWIDKNAQKIFSKKTKLPVKVINDADAAGVAEKKFGVGKEAKGNVILVTVGTGIGTVLFNGNKLVPNTELGHVFLENSLTAEKYAADSVRQTEGLDWTQWGKRFNVYLKEIEKLFWPELIIIGGGVSKKKEKFIHAININTKIKMAKLKNEAGIIGAAIAASRLKSKK